MNASGSDLNYDLTVFAEEEKGFYSEEKSSRK